MSLCGWFKLVVVCLCTYFLMYPNIVIKVFVALTIKIMCWKHVLNKYREPETEGVYRRLHFSFVTPSVYYQWRFCFFFGTSTYNLNFSFHLGFKVCGLMDVAQMNLAGTGPPSESRCSRLLLPSRLLKLKRKLCLRCGGESAALLSNALISADRARGVGGSGNGDTGGPPSGCIPSMQYGSENPVKQMRNYNCYTLEVIWSEKEENQKQAKFLTTQTFFFSFVHFF